MNNFQLPSALLVAVTGLSLAPGLTPAQTWTPTSAPSNNWGAIVCSSDGTKVLASAPGDGFYASTDSGSNWTKSRLVLADQSSYHLASSADGIKMVAAGSGVVTAGSGAPIYTSTNSGFDWSQTSAPVTNWYSVASSADGTHLIAVGYIPVSGGYTRGFAYTSTNSGATWQRQAGLPSQPLATSSYFSVCSSADGSKLAVAANNGGPPVIYTSTDFGVTWVGNWLVVGQLMGILSSADCSMLVAARTLGTVYNSKDFGATWKTNSLPNPYCKSIAPSADGTRLVAGCYGYTNVGMSGHSLPGPIYTSADSGTTWTSNNVQTRVWVGVASSADGSKLYAVEQTGGQIYTSQSTPTPTLALTPGTTNIALAWIFPATNFILQQSGDMSSWLDLTNMPVLDLSTLRDQVMLAKPSSNTFYRLKTP